MRIGFKAFSNLVNSVMQTVRPTATASTTAFISAVTSMTAPTVSANFDQSSGQLRVTPSPKMPTEVINALLQDMTNIYFRDQRDYTAAYPGQDTSHSWGWRDEGFWYAGTVGKHELHRRYPTQWPKWLIPFEGLVRDGFIEQRYRWGDGTLEYRLNAKRQVN